MISVFVQPFFSVVSAVSAPPFAWVEQYTKYLTRPHAQYVSNYDRHEIQKTVVVHQQTATATATAPPPIIMAKNYFMSVLISPVTLPSHSHR